VARTNNDLESVFHSLKHGERRRSGRKTLTHDFEVLPPAAALATNLLHPDYVHLMCGSLEHLAGLDVSHRSCSIAAGSPSNSTTVESASFSTIDKRLVRRPVFEDRVLAASQCV
jgi:hypothetical protein